MNDESGRVDGLELECRFFLGDRPCVWHKREGSVCRCDRYRPIGDRVLLIKLDAMGDVLRTTALLDIITSQHRDCALTWVTRSESVPLLENNPLIAETIAYGPDTIVQLTARRFDRVINLDAGKISAGLAALAKAPQKDGYVLHERGHVVPTNRAAEAWLRMGVDDTLKRRGVRAYQAWMTDILGSDRATTGYVLDLRPDERARGRAHLARLGVSPDAPVVGLNTGAGGRWPLKQWRPEGFLELAAALRRERPVQFLLLGGPSERPRNEWLASQAPGVFLDPGCDNTVRHFAALTEACDVVVTGDTLAMHIALALRRRVVVLFGPTSAPEIELYGLGEKVTPDMTCLGCYKTSCDFVPNCMDLISSDMVTAAVRRQLALAGRDPASVAASAPAGASLPSIPSHP